MTRLAQETFSNIVVCFSQGRLLPVSFAVRSIAHPVRRSSTLKASMLVAVGAVFACISSPANAACPPGSQFFAYGGAGGCIKPGSNEVVTKCYRLTTGCPTGWSQEHQDDQGRWCCPPSPASKVGEQCQWRGTAPFCDGDCEPGERLRLRSQAGPDPAAYPGFGQRCVSGFKAYCCRPLTGY